MTGPDIDLPRLHALAEGARDATNPGRWAAVHFNFVQLNLIRAADPITILALIRRVQTAETELLTARKVVEAARAIPLGFDYYDGPLNDTMQALDDALTAPV